MIYISKSWRRSVSDKRRNIDDRIFFIRRRNIYGRLVGIMMGEDMSMKTKVVDSENEDGQKHLSDDDVREKDHQRRSTPHWQGCQDVVEIGR
jgi:hypothetical protein